MNSRKARLLSLLGAPSTAGLVLSSNGNWISGSGGGVTQEDIDDSIASHAGLSDPHTGYATDADLSAHVAASDPHTGYQRESEKAQANGYASLDGNARVPMAQLASGSPDGTKFIRDDGTLQTPSGGGGGLSHAQILARGCGA